MATVEIKYFNAPNLKRSYKIALEDLRMACHFVVTPGSDNYKIQQGVEILSLFVLLEKPLGLI